MVPRAARQSSLAAHRHGARHRQDSARTLAGLEASVEEQSVSVAAVGVHGVVDLTVLRRVEQDYGVACGRG